MSKFLCFQIQSWKCGSTQIQSVLRIWIALLPSGALSMVILLQRYIRAAFRASSYCSHQDFISNIILCVMFQRQIRKRLLVSWFLPDQSEHSVSRSQLFIFIYKGTQKWVLVGKPLKGYIGKQCRPSSDVALCGVWSGSPLFANSNFCLEPNKPKTLHPIPLSSKWTLTIYKGGKVHQTTMGKRHDEDTAVIACDGTPKLGLAKYWHKLAAHTLWHRL